MTSRSFFYTYKTVTNKIKGTTNKLLDKRIVHSQTQRGIVFLLVLLSSFTSLLRLNNLGLRTNNKLVIKNKIEITKDIIGLGLVKLVSFMTEKEK